MDLRDKTAFTESFAGGDLEMLQFALDRARAQFAWKCDGLDAAALRQAHPPSTLTLAGLLLHCAGVERRTIAMHVAGEPPEPPWDDPEWEWRAATEEDADEVYRLWREATEHCDAVWARALGEGGLDQPSQFSLEDGGTVSLRRPFVDRIEHYLRHTGHADLIRESIDGLVGEDPPG